MLMLESGLVNWWYGLVCPCTVPLASTVLDSGVMPFDGLRKPSLFSSYSGVMEGEVEEVARGLWRDDKAIVLLLRPVEG